ncbi:MAG: hypothetical protein P8Y91_08735, partial [Desulfuromonadales bacterium]
VRPDLSLNDAETLRPVLSRAARITDLGNQRQALIERERQALKLQREDEARLQKAREDVHFRQQALKDRLSRLDEEIILLQNRIMDMQSQIDSVESFVEKNLVF